MKENKEQFVELLSKFKVGMLTSLSVSGGLHTRPMALAEVSDKGHLFLLTDRNSEKVDELEQDGRVALSCQDDSGCYVTLSGMASLKKDPDKIEELWNAEFDAWFPDGASQALLIQVEPHVGEFWDMTGLAKAKYIYELLKAKVTDETPDVEQYHSQI